MRRIFTCIAIALGVVVVGAAVSAKLKPPLSPTEKTHLVLSQFAAVGNFELLKADDPQNFSLADGLRFSSLILVKEKDKLSEFVTNNQNRSSTLINSVSELRESMASTYPEDYKKLNDSTHLKLFYHSIRSIIGSSRETYVGFIIDESTGVVFIDYWED